MTPILLTFCKHRKIWLCVWPGAPPLGCFSIYGNSAMWQTHIFILYCLNCFKFVFMFYGTCHPERGGYKQTNKQKYIFNTVCFYCMDGLCLKDVNERMIVLSQKTGLVWYAVPNENTSRWRLQKILLCTEGHRGITSTRPVQRPHLK